MKLGFKGGGVMHIDRNLNLSILIPKNPTTSCRSETTLNRTINITLDPTKDGGYHKTALMREALGA